jgi:hypothetical protein
MTQFQCNYTPVDDKYHPEPFTDWPESIVEDEGWIPIGEQLERLQIGGEIREMMRRGYQHNFANERDAEDYSPLLPDNPLADRRLDFTEAADAARAIMAQRPKPTSKKVESAAQIPATEPEKD